MNQVAQIRPANGLSAKQLATVKNTVAKDTDALEFDLFIAICNRTGLDPFRRQVFPVVYNKNKPDKRRMVVVIGQDGQRVIAQRCGNYRPASEPTEYEIDPAQKGPLNPLGIVFARVKLWQQDNRGDWWPVIGEAYWDEFAPIADEWGENEAGQRRPTGKKTLDSSGQWAKMPRIMIQKCATMQALRAGWPDQFGGLYDEAETDRQLAQDRTASEIVDAEFEEQRLVRIGGGKDALMVQFDPDSQLERVQIGQFADRVLGWIKDKCDGSADLGEFERRNCATLREFWAKSPSDALELKKRIEGAHAAFRGAP